MTEQEKLNLLEEIMEADSGTLRPDSALRDLPDWDSMAALSFVAMLKEQFGKTVGGQQLRSFTTVRQLIDLM